MPSKLFIFTALFFMTSGAFARIDICSTILRPALINTAICTTTQSSQIVVIRADGKRVPIRIDDGACQAFASAYQTEAKCHQLPAELEMMHIHTWWGTRSYIVSIKNVEIPQTQTCDAPTS